MKNLDTSDLMNFLQTNPTLFDAPMRQVMMDRLKVFFPVQVHQSARQLLRMTERIESAFMPMAAGSLNYEEPSLIVTTDGRLAEVHQNHITSLNLNFAVCNVYRNGRFVVATSVNGEVYTGSMMSPILPEISPHLHNITSVALGYFHCLAVDYLGAVYSWGDCSSGKCGRHVGMVARHAEHDFVPNPTKINFNIPVRSAAAGLEHSLLVASNGKLYAFGVSGHNADAPASNTKIHELDIPTIVQFNNELLPIRIKVAVAGMRHSIALDEKGAVFGWGRNDYGQIDMAHVHRTSPVTSVVRTPVRLHAFYMEVVSIAAGCENSFAVTKEGLLYAWGRGTDSSSDYPTLVKPLNELRHKVVAVSVSQEIEGAILAVTDNGNVYSGETESLQLSYSGMLNDISVDDIAVIPCHRWRLLNVSCTPHHPIQINTNPTLQTKYTLDEALTEWRKLHRDDRYAGPQGIQTDIDEP